MTGAIWVAAILTECDSAPSHLGKVPQAPRPSGGLLLLFFIVRWCVNVFSKLVFDGLRLCPMILADVMLTEH